MQPITVKCDKCNYHDVHTYIKTLTGDADLAKCDNCEVYDDLRV